MTWNLEEAISYYQGQGAPGDQNALVNLLKEVQREHGDSIPPAALETIAETCGIKRSFLEAVIRRYPSLRLGEGHCLEICCGPNCSRHYALSAYAESLTSDLITVKTVPCMRMCGKGPNIRWDGKVYHQADKALLNRLTGTK